MDNIKTVKIKVGIVGCGTVGTGAVKLLIENADVIEKRTGISIELVSVADKDWSRKREFDIPESLKTENYKEVLEKSDIVVELVGGLDFAFHLINEVLDKDKHVVTANKHLLAKKGNMIFEKAKVKGLKIGFEASVGGGIPVIKALKEGLVGNRIKAIYGILNGTTNYILTKMLEEGVEFSNALKEAQEKGYAEADPSLDIDGWDTAHKIAILACMAYGKFFNFDDILVEGISSVNNLDVELGKELGYTLKLLAIAKRMNHEIEIRVHPTFIPSGDALAKVSSVYNAVMIEGDFVGKTMYYGKGAGSLPTASAVISDIVDIAKSIVTSSRGNNFIFNWEKEDIKLTKNFYSRYYLRFNVPDKTGVLASISRVFADYNISIASVLQKEKVCRIAGKESEHIIPLVILTHKAYEIDVKKALYDIERLPVVEGEPILIRVEEEAY